MDALHDSFPWKVARTVYSNFRSIRFRQPGRRIGENDEEIVRYAYLDCQLILQEYLEHRALTSDYKNSKVSQITIDVSTLTGLISRAGQDGVFDIMAHAFLLSVEARGGRNLLVAFLKSLNPDDTNSNIEGKMATLTPNSLASFVAVAYTELQSIFTAYVENPNAASSGSLFAKPVDDTQMSVEEGGVRRSDRTRRRSHKLEDSSPPPSSTPIDAHSADIPSDTPLHTEIDEEIHPQTNELADAPMYADANSVDMHTDMLLDHMISTPSPDSPVPPPSSPLSFFVDCFEYKPESGSEEISPLLDMFHPFVDHHPQLLTESSLPSFFTVPPIHALTMDSSPRSGRGTRPKTSGGGRVGGRGQGRGRGRGRGRKGREDVSIGLDISILREEAEDEDDEGEMIEEKQKEVARAVSSHSTTTNNTNKHLVISLRKPKPVFRRQKKNERLFVLSWDEGSVFCPFKGLDIVGEHRYRVQLNTFQGLRKKFSKNTKGAFEALWVYELSLLLSDAPQTLGQQRRMGNFQVFRTVPEPVPLPRTPFEYYLCLGVALVVLCGFRQTSWDAYGAGLGYSTIATKRTALDAGFGGSSDSDGDKEGVGLARPAETGVRLGNVVTRGKSNSASRVLAAARHETRLESSSAGRGRGGGRGGRIVGDVGGGRGYQRGGGRGRTGGLMGRGRGRGGKSAIGSEAESARMHASLFAEDHASQLVDILDKLITSEGPGMEGLTTAVEAAEMRGSMYEEVYELYVRGGSLRDHHRTCLEVFQDLPYLYPLLPNMRVQKDPNAPPRKAKMKQEEGCGGFGPDENSDAGDKGYYEDNANTSGLLLSVNDGDNSDEEDDGDNEVGEDDEGEELLEQEERKDTGQGREHEEGDDQSCRVI
eukprot:gene29271-35338_t